MGQRNVGEAESGAVNFVGFGVGQRIAMAWSLVINCRIPLYFHFTVTTSLAVPPAAAEREALPKP